MSPTDLVPPMRALPWGAPTTVLAIVAVLAFAGLGLRGLVDPAGAAASFGLRGVEGDGLMAMRATGARNLAMALVGLVLVALDARNALAIVILGAGLIATLDVLIVWQGVGPQAVAKHAAYAVTLLAFGTFVAVWRTGG